MAVKTKGKGKGFDERGTGPEPEWDTERALKMDDKTFRLHLSNSLRYYSYHYSSKDLKKYVVIWMQENGYNNDDVSAFVKSPTSYLGGTVCGLIMASRQGMPLKDDALNFIKKTIADVSAKVDPFADQTEKVEKVQKKVTTPELTIQDRIKIKINEHIGHFEEQQDLLSTVGKVDPKTFAYLKKENVPQNMLKGIAEPFMERLAEWQEAKAGTCEDLKEAYGHWQAKDYKKYFAFVEGILADIDAYAKTKKAVKVARVKKAPNKQKLVSKVKYAKDNTQYKVASVDPVTIIGAIELYVFNVKTRKLGKYVADPHMGVLGIKGTTVVGFDTIKSTQKTLRKPERQLPEFTGASKANKRKYLNTIKSVEIALNGRLNSDTILLHVQ